MISHPTPWRIEGDTIRDAAGGVVVSALNPCTMSTRRKIVDAVNEHDTLKQRLKDAIDIADAFHKELQHVLDCLCYAGQTKSSLAGGAMEKPQTESPKGSTTWKGAFVARAGELENAPEPHAAPCRVPPDARRTSRPPAAMASGENRDGELGRRSATELRTPRKRCGFDRDGCGLADGQGESLDHWNQPKES